MSVTVSLLEKGNFYFVWFYIYKYNYASFFEVQEELFLSFIKELDQNYMQENIFKSGTKIL